MGPINWLAVLAAAAAAATVLWAFWRGRIAAPAYLLTLIPAAMLGHALARIGAEKLAAKPQLYFMQAGGLALAIAVPALWLLGFKAGARAGEMARDSAALTLGYLAMGAVFYLAG